MKRLTIIICIFLSLTAIAAEQREKEYKAPSVHSLHSRDIDEKVSDNISSDLKVKIIKLEEQNKILKSSSSDLRNSYYWALGFSATFLLVFLGINLYSANRRFDDEKKNFETMLNNKIENEVLTINKIIEEHHLQNIGIIKNEIHEIENKNNEFNKLITERLLEVDDSTKAKYEELNKKILVNNESIKTESNKLEEYTNNKIRSAKIDIEFINLKISEILDVKRNTIAQAIKLSKLCNEDNKLNANNNNDWLITKCLDIIDKITKIDVGLSHFEVKDITDHLNDLSSSHGIFVNRIIENIK
ncbi:hypothetical protein [Pseudoalteromonas sp. MMG007]|uniref:hypothetical protein n=1 Tax=Pseudoalteromonas sp. MMG007 TaxID=2822684 RepID=UPI001B37E47C|nr:hypothetical protein [Pseudoalteromonas sp. MMG007]MBQ4859319.1 hypothetical protein [Pseudoalteromonas sp. MMG007]